MTQPTNYPPMTLADTARHVLATAQEPDALERIRAILDATHANGYDDGVEYACDQIREVALQRANLSEQRAEIARRHLPHDPTQAASNAAWSANLADQAAAVRSVLGHLT
jgi:hypothetical protein